MRDSGIYCSAKDLPRAGVTQPMKTAALRLFETPESPEQATSLPFADYAYPQNKALWSGLVLVGEAPGAEEARTGRPFVGRSGQLLDKALHEAGIDRARAIIANVFRRQPPGNKIDHFFASRRAALRGGVTLAEEYGKFAGKFCRADFAADIAHLQSMLRQWKPRAIIALGRTPLWALTGLDGLMQHAGTAHPCRLYDGAEVTPTFHPSFILRGNWKLQGDWVAHMRRAQA
ncbi:MAG: uracil-DNA glycosylase [Alphaproteobacteria bacterium]|nr:uracil-DNA glycosylase [Alphaproteobacteria bacterium]